MQFESLNPAEKKINTLKKAISSSWNIRTIGKNQIQQGMTPTEIADIVSDHLISVVRKQFEAKKKELYKQSE